MKKMFFAAFAFFTLLLLRPYGAFAADPVLFFSDITSGPKTGNTDGRGSGAIISVWGNNLGTTQGTSKIYVGGAEASYVYYWGKADRTGASGPADLYTFHKAQTVSFAVAANAADGAGEIYAVVNGKRSNSLQFTVRSGRIYFVKTTGTDGAGNNGSWSAPWKTLTYTGSGAGGRVAAGDIVYATDGVQELSGFILRSMVGTAANPISWIAYPGANVLLQGNVGIGNYNADNSYTNFAKFTIKTKSNGIDAFKGMRAVANEITNYPGSYADGQGGAISGSNFSGKNTTGGGIKSFGNYIHDFGSDQTSKLHHVFYLSNRGGYAVESFELGWNYLKDNKAHHGLHVFDEGICGDFTGTMRIHDNVVVNQVGVAVGVASGGSGSCFTMPVEIYNNLFINPGQETTTCGGGHNQAISLAKSTNRSNIKVYNNTLYGYGISGGSTAWALDIENFGGTWEFVNNIIVDTHNLPYQGYNQAATVHSNNLYYNGGDGIPATPPSWDTSPLTSNPLFTNAGSNQFTLQLGSPARDTGKNTSPVVLRDILGTPRGTTYSIGAFESDDVVSPSAPVLTVQ